MTSVILEIVVLCPHFQWEANASPPCGHPCNPGRISETKLIPISAKPKKVLWQTIRRLRKTKSHTTLFIRNQNSVLQSNEGLSLEDGESIS